MSYIKPTPPPPPIPPESRSMSSRNRLSNYQSGDLHITGVNLIGSGYSAILEITVGSQNGPDYGFDDGEVFYKQFKMKDVLFTYNKKFHALTIQTTNSAEPYKATEIIYKGVIDVMQQWCETLPSVDPELMILVASETAKKTIEQHLKVFTQSLIKLTDTLDKSETALSGLNTLARKADVIKKDIENISSLFKE